MPGYRTGVSPRHVPASVTELQRVGLLASLPGQTLARLADRMRREEVPGGHTVVAEVTRERESLEERFHEITGGATADEVKA